MISYTDWHDVDEDMATTVKYGASWDWTFGVQAGVTSQTMTDTHAASNGYVASMRRHSRIIFMIIRITIMSTKMRGLSRFMVVNGRLSNTVVYLSVV